MNKQQIATLVLFLLAFLNAGFVHFVNNKTLSALHPELLREQTTVLTSDDASYLAPAKNFLEGKEWKSNVAGKGAIISRSPGYGLLYVAFRVLLPAQSALVALVIFQIGLYATAVALLPRIGSHLNLNDGLSLAIAIGVAILPTFFGFLSYTLTEAITPALVLIFLFGLFRFYHAPRQRVLPVALLLGFIIVVRPPMIIWIFSVLILAVYHFREMRFKKLFILAVISLIPITVWQVFISTKTGELQGLHPIYQDDSNDLYRPLHNDIWNFHKSWGQTGADFNATVNQLWKDAMHDHNPEKTITQILQRSDKHAVGLIGKDSLRHAYALYFQILQKQVPYAKRNLPVNGISDKEKELSATFNQFRKTYVGEHWFYSNILVPAKVYFSLGAHSNLSLFVFQKTWRGNFLMEFLRYFSFLIHLGIFLCFPIALVLTRKSVLWLSISIPVIIYLGYLCIIQRGIEERYTLPVLIPMLLVVAGAGQKVFTRWRFHWQNWRRKLN